MIAVKRIQIPCWSGTGRDRQNSIANGKGVQPQRGGSCPLHQWIDVNLLLIIGREGPTAQGVALRASGVVRPPNAAAALQA